METSFNNIASDLKCGRNLKLGNFVTIESNVIIGENVTIESYSMIKSGARIHDGVFIGTYSKVGTNSIIENHVKMTSYVEIRDNCRVGARSTFGSRCTLSAGTIVESDVIVKYGFVATDTPILSSKERKLCLLKMGSQFGANVVIMPGVIVGKNAEIGACSQVRNDIPDDEIWYGNPAKFYKRKSL